MATFCGREGSSQYVRCTEGGRCIRAHAPTIYANVSSIISRSLEEVRPLDPSRALRLKTSSMAHWDSLTLFFEFSMSSSMTVSLICHAFFHDGVIQTHSFVAASHTDPRMFLRCSTKVSHASTISGRSEGLGNSTASSWLSVCMELLASTALIRRVIRPRSSPVAAVQILKASYVRIRDHFKGFPLWDSMVELHNPPYQPQPPQPFIIYGPLVLCPAIVRERIHNLLYSYQPNT
jgi:hypothetical protein